MKSLHADSAKGVKIPTRVTVTAEVGEKRSRDDDEEDQSVKRQKTALDCSVGSPLTSGSSSSDEEASLPTVNPFWCGYSPVTHPGSEVYKEEGLVWGSR